MRSHIRLAAALAALVVLGLAAPAAAQVNAALVTADQAFVQAASRKDAAALAMLLDSEATWTDAQGRTVSAAELRRTVPAVGIADEATASVRRHDYGRVGVVQVSKGKMEGLRVWVQRPAGWRLMAYQEIRLLDKLPATTPGTGGTCVNPCKEVPYTPKTDVERAVITAYQSLETTAVASDADKWGLYVADEFVLASSNGDRTLDKATRVAGLRKQTHGGVMPTQLLSATLYEFGDAVVMKSRHRPDKGDDLQITRVWVKRGGRWMATLSYQTSIRAPK